MARLTSRRSKTIRKRRGEIGQPWRTRVWLVIDLAGAEPGFPPIDGSHVSEGWSTFPQQRGPERGHSSSWDMEKSITVHIIIGLAKIGLEGNKSSRQQN